MVTDSFRTRVSVTPEELDQLRHTVADACRILAHEGVAEGVLGHVSVRVGEDLMLLRCRGPEDRGLMFTEPEDIRLVDFNAEGELDGGYVVPNEQPIHAEILRARPDVDAVVHVHPPSVVVAHLAGVRFRPVFGAYNIPAFRMASQPIPVYPHAGLVRTPGAGRDLATALGDSDVCLLHGHGAVTVGDRVEQAVVRMLNLDELARISLELERLGARPEAVSAEDARDLPDLGSAFNDASVWRYHLGRLRPPGAPAARPDPDPERRGRRSESSYRT
jgi:ribulose-5-phosphate 4-epimerase/fuculose-1-phosphate aldolase